MCNFVFYVIVEPCAGYLLSNRAFTTSDEAYDSDEYKQAKEPKEVERCTIPMLESDSGYGTPFKEMVW